MDAGGQRFEDSRNSQTPVVPARAVELALKQPKGTPAHGGFVLAILKAVAARVSRHLTLRPPFRMRPQLLRNRAQLLAHSRGSHGASFARSASRFCRASISDCNVAISTALRSVASRS